MNVADVMSYRPLVIGSFATVEEAALLMRAQVVGALPVVEHDRPIGIITDRDLTLRCVAAGERPWEQRVREVMSGPPATCQADEPIESAIARMAARRVRRLIVVGDSGAVVGMLTLDDLLLGDATRAAATEVLRQILALRGELDGVLSEVRP